MKFFTTDFYGNFVMYRQLSFICINTSSEAFIIFTISTQYYEVVKTENNGTSIVKIASKIRNLFQHQKIQIVIIY